MMKIITGKNEYPVTAHIYESDVLNPKWYIKRKTFEKILHVWKELKNTIMPASFSAGIGYKGLTLSANERQIVCNNNSVTMYYNNIIEAKLDTEGTIENAILKDSPENLLKEINYHLNCYEEERKYA
jgi:hypothetical protein